MYIYVNKWSCDDIYNAEDLINENMFYPCFPAFTPVGDLAITIKKPGYPTLKDAEKDNGYNQYNSANLRGKTILKLAAEIDKFMPVILFIEENTN